MKGAFITCGRSRRLKREHARKLLLAGLINLTLVETHAAVASSVITGKDIDISGPQTPAVEVAAADSVEMTDSRITTRGQSSAALQVMGTLTGSSVTLRTTGLAAAAIDATAGGTVNLSGVIIGTEGIGAVALSAQNGSRITLKDGSVSTTQSMGYGVHIGTDSRVELDNIKVAVEGESSHGAAVFNNGTLRLTAGSHLSTLGHEGHGVLLMGDNASSTAKATIIGGQVSTSGDYSVGINVNSDAIATLRNTHIITTGKEAYGVWLASGGTQASLEGGSIFTTGENSVGVSSQGGTATLKDLSITTSGKQAHGLYSDGRNSTIDATDTSIWLNDTGVGVFAVNGGQIRLEGTRVNATLITTRNGGTALRSALGAGITATNVTVQAAGNGAAAAIMDRGAVLTLENVRASATGAGSIGLGAVATASSQANRATVDGGSLTADGSAIAVRGGQLDLTLRGVDKVSGQLLLDIDENVVNGNTVAHGNVRVSAINSTLIGDVQVKGASVGKSWLGLDNSSLTGAVQNLDQLEVLNPLSSWTMTGDSTLGDLNNSGTVAFQSGAGFKTLTVEGDLTGSGLFALNTDLANGRGDLLKVLGTIHNDHTLAIADSGNEPAAADGELMVVDGNGGAGRFALAGRPYVDAGAFRYTLEQDGDDWLLRNTSLAPVDAISAGSNAALSNQVAASTLWSAEMNAVVKRLGELRMGDDRGGVWTRGIGKSFDVKNNRSRAFKQNVRGVEIGADKAIDVPIGKLYLGGMVGTATSTQSYGDGGSGEINSQLLGVYATWMDEHGYYLDSVLKYNRMDNEVKTLANTGNRIKGSYRTTGYAADIEVGRQIKLEDNWFVEPQLELTYTHLSDSRYTSSNGLRVAPGDAVSLQGRVGAVVGKTLTQSNGLGFQPYVKASYVNELAGNSSVKVNGHKLTNRIADSHGELGIGGVLQVSEKTKVSLDVEHAQGRQVNQPWAVNVGVRYLW